MKSIFLVVVSGFVLSMSAQAQKSKKASSIKVPEAVNSSFETSFLNSEKSKWNQNYSGNYVVNFVNADKQNQTVEYSSTGTLVKAKTTYTAETYPEIVTTSLSAKYPEAKIIDVIRMELQGVKPYYSVKIEKSENRKKTIFISEEGVIAE